MNKEHRNQALHLQSWEIWNMLPYIKLSKWWLIIAQVDGWLHSRGWGQNLHLPHWLIITPTKFLFECQKFLLCSLKLSGVPTDASPAVAAINGCREGLVHTSKQWLTSHCGKPRTSSHSDFTGGKKELLGYSSLNVFNPKGRQAGFGYTAMDSDDPAHNVQLNLIRHIWAAAEYC